MAAEEFFGVFPVKGLKIASGEAHSQIFERDWTTVGVDDVNELNKLLSDGKGFMGNLEMIARRINPSSFLIVKAHVDELNFWGWKKLAQHSENIVAGLNLLSLQELESVSFGSDRDTIKRALPSPIWSSTVKEFCELPVLFDQQSVRMVGHSSSAPTWPLLEKVQGKPLTNAELDNQFMLGDANLNEILLGRAPAAQRNALKALAKCFDCSSVGQFNAQCLGCLDILFGESETKRWKEMQKWTLLLAPGAEKSNVERLFSARHQFIHRGKEPPDTAMHLKCLATTLLTISNYAKLLGHFGNPAAVRELLSATSLLEAAESKIEGETFPSVIQGHLDVGPTWVRDWLNVEVYLEPHIRKK